MTQIFLNNKLNGIEIKFDKAPIPPTRQALKDNGFKWNGKKLVWYAKQTAKNFAFVQLLTGIAKNQMQTCGENAEPKAEQKPDKQKELKDILKECLADAWEDEHMREYCLKSTAYIVELSTGDIVTIDKPSIQKDFCFGYGFYGVSDEESEKHAENMVTHSRTNQEYFINENMKQLDDRIEAFKKLDTVRLAYIVPNYTGQSANNKLKCICFSRVCENERYIGKYPELTQEDISRLIAGYEEVKKQFRKRLDTYLKKYGLSKVNSWSYLRD